MLLLVLIGIFGYFAIMFLALVAVKVIDDDELYWAFAVLWPLGLIVLTISLITKVLVFFVEKTANNTLVVALANKIKKLLNKSNEK